MEGFDGHSGISKLAEVMDQRTRNMTDSPLAIDFGTIQANGSLLTDTFPVPIPKGDFLVCRQLALGEAGSILTATTDGGSHSHDGMPQAGKDGEHRHEVTVPDKMRSIRAGDRVLVAWVQSEAVVVDIVER